MSRLPVRPGCSSFSLRSCTIQPFISNEWFCPLLPFLVSATGAVARCGVSHRARGGLKIWTFSYAKRPDQVFRTSASDRPAAVIRRPQMKKPASRSEKRVFNFQSPGLVAKALMALFATRSNALTTVSNACQLPVTSPNVHAATVAAKTVAVRAARKRAFQLCLLCLLILQFLWFGTATSKFPTWVTLILKQFWL